MALRRHRFRITFFVVFSLLFSQLALANYVCPAEQDATAMAESMAAGMPCGGTDSEQPALCAEHSAGAPQSVEAAKLPAVSAPMVVHCLEIPLALDDVAARTVAATAHPVAQPPPPPLFLSTLRLRV